MSATVLTAVRPIATQEQQAPSGPQGRPRLVSVPTGREAGRTARAARIARDPRTAPAGRDARVPMRLTRFGRLVVSLLVASVVALLAVGLAGQLASATGEPRTLTVQPGQTLSGIAARELPGLSRADGVLELQLANGLSTSQIHAGQQLVVPGS
ncbi:LysM peptidoglycan-binding domain-containing protein [Terrabacter sp. NPDC000476]|uniref:LysM peptidoglycan-binding domain-containing protein n=1 Tax=Terrabacter sp. NPDC000476 TaxID=3154258 RepID=UPI003321FBB0